MSDLGQVAEALFPFPCRPRSNSPLGPLRRAQNGPRGAQDGPRGVQDGSKTVQERSKTPKLGPRRSKRPPRRPQMAPRRSKRPPRRPKWPPRGFPGGPKEAEPIGFPLFLTLFLVLAFWGQDPWALDSQISRIPRRSRNQGFQKFQNF